MRSFRRFNGRFLSISIVFILLSTIACSKMNKPNKESTTVEVTEDLTAILDTIWRTEQEPISLRDDFIDTYGVDSKEAQEQQEIYKENHTINEKIIEDILSRYGWPDQELIGEQHNRTICNVIQHSDNEIRIKYLPMMQQAVKDKKLDPAFLVRAEDRIATERGDLQIYGGQMKYYPETKSFNVWPVADPVNIDKRRAAIGLGPIAEHLKNRFDFDWDLEEQIRRTEAFEKQRFEQTAE